MNSDQFSFRSIEIFMAVIEERSVTKAAKRFGCSASTVSSQLSKLETSLGATLIERTAQRFEITAAGNIFIERAQRILDEVIAVKSNFTEQGYTTKLHLRIAVIEDFDAQILPLWLKAVREDYPHCTFDVKSGTSHESHEALYSRRVDMIVAADSTGFIDGIDEYQVFDDPYLLIASQKVKSLGTIQELLAFPFIRYSHEQLLAQQIEAQLRRSRIKPMQGFMCSTTPAVFSLVDAFDGWTIAPSTATIATIENGQFSAQNLTAKPLSLPKFSRTISLYCRSESLGDMPEKIAKRLRNAIDETLTQQLEAYLPFLKTHAEKQSNFKK